VTYGVSRQADYSARTIQFRGFSTRASTRTAAASRSGGFTVRMPGAHNVLNCLAVIAVADELEVPLDVTRDLFGEFTRAFNKADVLLVTEVYAAGEAPIAGANGEHLANAIRAHGHKNVRYVADKKDVAAELEKIVRPGDIVFALGAGDINAQIRELSKRLEAEAKDPA
jgi:UDP-N-acetylmuramate-alanine ligase